MRRTSLRGTHYFAPRSPRGALRGNEIIAHRGDAAQGVRSETAPTRRDDGHTRVAIRADLHGATEVVIAVSQPIRWTNPLPKEFAMTSSLHRVVQVALALAALALSSTAIAQPALITGLGGPRGYGTTCLSPNDDGSTNAISILPAFPSGVQFFTGHYTQFWINTNGNITFNGPVPVFTPNPFPVASQPMIAPYWADVDIRFENGSCMGGVGTSSSGSGPCLNPSTNGVWWNMSPGRLVVTWDNVGYYTCHTTPVMNFQLVLTAPPGGCPGDFDVEFRYNHCGWETGDASGGVGGFGGTQAQAGFDAGNSRDYVAIPGSRMAGIAAHLCSSSNVMPTMPGIWRFQIRHGVIMCPGAGMACNTGMPGICSDGLTQCMGMGMSCVGTTVARATQCNGLDNNCDGTIDTGPCPSGQVCDGAQCVPMCVEGGCFTGQECTSRGTCVDAACATVTCPAGQRCSMGTCVGGCTGVTCPLGQVCRIGQCVDPCAGITCDAMSVCVAGVCQPRCGMSCAGCPMGQTCGSDGVCHDPACATMTCPAGTVCQSGTCADACTGAVCPSGQMCTGGNCVAIPVADAGTPDDAGTTGDGGTSTDAGSGDAHASGDASADARRDGGHFTGSGNPGCGCRTAGSAGSSGAAIVAALFAAAALASRRRARGGRRRRPRG
jgi:hypothetical protein